MPESVILTGATGKIGEAIARGVLERGHSLILPVRNTVKAGRMFSGSENINIIELDISEKDDYRVMTDLDLTADVLINCAAITPRKRKVSSEGLEMQFAVNILGYARMIEASLPLLRRSSSARIVNVASYWAGDVDLNDLQFEGRHYNNNTAYRQSKACDRMLSHKYAEFLTDDNIPVNSCHPGDVKSGLSSSLGFGGHESPAEAAETPLWLAFEADRGLTGRYFQNRHEVSCRFSADKASVNRLFDILADFQ